MILCGNPHAQYLAHKAEIDALRRKISDLKNEKDDVQAKLDAAFQENKKLFGTSSFQSCDSLH